MCRRVKTVKKEEDGMREDIIKKMEETSDYIFRNPELSLKEYKSSRALADFLGAEGFTVRWGIAGFETAFAAEWSNGHCKNELEESVQAENGSTEPIEPIEPIKPIEPVIGFLAEYDALPDLGRSVCPGSSRTEARAMGAVTICWEPPVRARPVN